MPGPEARRRILAWALGLMLVVLTLLLGGANLYENGARSIAASDRAWAAGDVLTAIEEAREAARSLAPWSPYPEQGFARLATIAEASEARGNLDQAAVAWRATWTAIRSTRSEAREAARLNAAHRALARLATRACEGGQTRVPETCSAVSQATMREDVLPPLAAFDWIAFGAVLFLAGGAAAAEGKTKRVTYAGGASLLVGLGSLAFGFLAR